MPFGKFKRPVFDNQAPEHVDPNLATAQQQIIATIGQEMTDGQFSDMHRIHFFGIRPPHEVQIPEAGGNHVVHTEADNCIYPDKYKNVFHYIAGKAIGKLLFWWVVPKQ